MFPFIEKGCVVNSGKEYSIFICEDDEFVCGLYASLLQDLPFSLVFFDSVDSILPALIANSPDLIITDMDLKQEKDGCDLIHTVREKKYQMPIFLITGINNARVKKTLKLPNVELIQKPFNIHKFIRKVCDSFDGEHVLL